MSDTGAHSQGNGVNPKAKTSEPHSDKRLVNEQLQDNESGTPDNLATFDWEEFEARYNKALADADANEQELMKQFDDLVKVRFA